MARFKETLKAVQALSAAMGSMPVVNKGQSLQASESKQSNDVAKQITDIMMKEDSTSIKIALLCDKLITKYKGRSV